MTEDRDTMLRRAAVRAFEELGMMLVEEAPGARARRGARQCTAIDFEGGVRGRLVLETTPAVASDLARSMVGAARRGSPALAGDALGELANVICGNVLAAIVPAFGPFRLMPPRATRDTARRAGEMPWAHAELAVERGWARVYLLLASPPGVG